MDDLRDRIYSILSRRSGVPRERLTDESRVVQDLRLDADDAIDALLEISRVFPIDFADFDSSLFFRSEPTLVTLFRHLFPKQRELPKRILTVGELIDAAQRGYMKS